MKARLLLAAALVPSALALGANGALAANPPAPSDPTASAEARSDAASAVPGWVRMHRQTPAQARADCARMHARMGGGHHGGMDHTGMMSGGMMNGA